MPAVICPVCGDSRTLSEDQARKGVPCTRLTGSIHLCDVHSVQLVDRKCPRCGGTAYRYIAVYCPGVLRAPPANVPKAE